MRNPKRPVAFVLANTDHGALILNRNDEHGEGAGRYGVGIQILTSGLYCADEVDLALSLLDLRRNIHGDGVVAVDCGANIGVHAIEWGRRMTGWGQVIAVEAQERIFYALAGNIAINNCFNVRAIHAAAGELDGVMRIPTLNHLEHASFGSLELKPLAQPEYIGQVVDYSDDRTAVVPATTLDSLKLERLDFIKIDVEGMENEVLRGGQTLIQRFKPILMIERHKSDAQTMGQLLRDWGYVVYDSGGVNLLAVHGADAARTRIVQNGAPSSGAPPAGG